MLHSVLPLRAQSAPVTKPMRYFMHFSDILLAIIQGATEFLPVSSSGHLVLAHHFFGMDAGLSFDIVLHAGTLLAVVWFYRAALWDLIRGFFAGLAQKRNSPQEPWDPRVGIVLYLCLATIVTAILGFALQDWVQTTFRGILAVGVLLLINSFILLLSRREAAFGLGSKELTLKSALLIGLAQGLAVLPGISRSGSTITMALLLGIRREDCAKYSFILSIPVILGALILHLGDMSSLVGEQIAWLVVCALVAAGVGLLCLKFLVRILQSMRFHYFAPYCFVIGVLAIVFGLVS